MVASRSNVVRIQLRGAAGLGSALTTRIPNGEGVRDIDGPSRVSCNAELGRARPRSTKTCQVSHEAEHEEAHEEGCRACRQLVRPEESEASSDEKSSREGDARQDAQRDVPLR